MKSIYQIENYLSGADFDSNLRMKVTKYFTPSKSRVESLVELATGKKVIHLGCCDHLELIPHKMQTGQWLHGRLEKVATSLIGLDINEEALDFLKKNGIQDVYKADITDPSKLAQITNKSWDVLIAAEIVEHVNDPIGFLQAIRKNYSANIDEIIITVPNAYGFNYVVNSLQNLEAANTDHKFLFTPFTISKILTLAGFKVQEIVFSNGENRLKVMNFPRLLFSWMFPMLRDTIIVRAKFNSECFN